MKKKVLITGVNGFIGQALKKYIKQHYKKFKVFGLDRKLSKKDKRAYLCSLNSKKDLQKILTSVRPCIIFHLAGGRFSSDIKTWKANFTSTKSLFDVITTIPNYNPRVIIPGTAAEYGKIPKGKRSVNEKLPLKPGVWYGFVKMMQTTLGLTYAKAGCDVVVARLFNISGEGTPSTLAMGQFAKLIVQIESNSKTKNLHTGRLDGKRDFLDIEDICAALVRLAVKGKSGEVYNVCSGKGVVIRDLLKTMLRLSSVKDIKIVEESSQQSPSFDIVGSNAKLKRVNGWVPKVKVEKSLKNTLEYYRKEK